MQLWCICCDASVQILHGRQAFYKSHNLVSPMKMAGGWSSHGQPVDQLHGVFRKAIRARDIESAGMFEDLRARPAYHMVDIKASGQLSYKVRPWAEVVQLTYDAWCSLDKKVFEAALLSCGYVDNDHFASFQPLGGHHNISVDEAKAVLSDIFSELGFGYSVQRCTQLEWQMEDCSQHSLYTEGHSMFMLFCLANCRFTENCTSHILGCWFHFHVCVFCRLKKTIGRPSRTRLLQRMFAH